MAQALLFALSLEERALFDAASLSQRNPPQLIKSLSKRTQLLTAPNFSNAQLAKFRQNIAP